MKSQMIKLSMLAAMVAGLMSVMPVHAATVLDVLTDTQDRYTGPTVEDNVALMDTDKNGFADAGEVRAFLELKHGKGYESEVLDRFEALLRGASCGTVAGASQLTN
ncbi:hypothetical protein [Methylotenera mobilis]|uniref:EF-hand domain-containing protein n=1 Tax=Methylotenera mobilis (strain JLW8 / ATCC BAA-1282 / DSM 17540) TaxID=583345 RepID=C6WUS6_METML|nr:hypothetical protein [Methylotenera mobilis]ACT47675.1 hypothetical protein Mmol_0765 [Methylotenera mobilis JLW8]